MKILNIVKYKNKNSKAGFTLLELMAVVAIFGFIIIAVTGIFLSGLRGVRKTYNKQNALDSSRFINELIAKELRMGSVITADGGGLPYTNIDITNQDGQTVGYSFSSNNFIRTQDGVSEILNSNRVIISSGAFYVKKDIGQPRVTIVMKVRSNFSRPAEQAEINLQTTISSR